MDLLMPRPNTKTDRETPLCVDLDGTLINTDMTFESMVKLVGGNPLHLFSILAWWTRGRAQLKAELGKRVRIDPSTLPYNASVMDFVRAEKSLGRKVLLVTASDTAMAQEIAAHLQIFDEVLASDGVRNLRGKNKGGTLAQLLGEKGFDYAGNSRVDLPVWERARNAILVNGSDALRGLAEKRAPVARELSRRGPVLPQLLRMVTPGAMAGNLVVLVPYAWAILAGGRPAAAEPLLTLVAILLSTFGGRVLNELFRMHEDRFDAVGRNRPFASGELDIHVGPVLGPALILAAGTLSAAVSPGLIFLVVLNAVLEVLDRPAWSRKGKLTLMEFARGAVKLLAGSVAVS
jgi:phosphoserine phosphatase